MVIRMIARVGFQRVRFGLNHSAILGERKNVWPRHPHGIEVHIQVEIVGQHGLCVSHQHWAILNERDTCQPCGWEIRCVFVFVLVA